MHPFVGLVSAYVVAPFQAQQIFVVTEPSLPDNPIVFASAGFLKLTGYKSEQANEWPSSVLRQIIFGYLLSTNWRNLVLNLSHSVAVI